MKDAPGFSHVGGTWVEMDTNVPSGESLVRYVFQFHGLVADSFRTLRWICSPIRTLFCTYHFVELYSESFNFRRFFLLSLAPQNARLCTNF